MTLRAAPYGRQSRGKAKSIDEQIRAGTAVADAHGWHVADTYEDGTSASRYARKGRDDWARCLADIAAGNLDILILWEASRGDRTLTTWSGLLDLCRDKGVSIYVVSDERLYDPRKPRDWKTLASAGVDSAGESDMLSVRVKRGHAGAAAAGRPGHGRIPYGYRRVHDSGTGELVGQEPDPIKAQYVQEIFRRLAEGQSIVSLVDDFNAREVPTWGAKKWYRTRVRDLAMNKAYIGARVHLGVEYAGTWPPLVDEEQFFAVQRILSDPKRVMTRPGRTRHLLSFSACCAVCGGRLEAVRGRYRCSDNGCITVHEEDCDDFVTRMVIGRLSQPDIYEQLRQRGDDDDRSVVEARVEAARLEDQLEVWRRSAIAGETSPASLAVIEADLTGKIRTLRRRVATEGVPPQLRAFVQPGADVEERWNSAPLPARRRAIEHLCHVLVDRADRPGSRLFEYERLSLSRWVGDPLTWGERWAADGA